MHPYFDQLLLWIAFQQWLTLDNLSADMDAANLYTEEIVTDRKMGTIHVLTPITPEGAKDPTRAPIFTGRSADR